MRSYLALPMLVNRSLTPYILFLLLGCPPGIMQAQQLEINDLSNHTHYRYYVGDTISYIRRDHDSVFHGGVVDFIPAGIVFTTNDTVAWSAIESIEGIRRIRDERTQKILTIAIPVSVMATIPIAAVTSNSVSAHLMTLSRVQNARLLVGGVVLAAGGLSVLGVQLWSNYQNRKMEARKPDYLLLDKTYRYKWKVKSKRPFDVT